jgi:cell shape-determining protein MreC
LTRRAFAYAVTVRVDRPPVPPQSLRRRCTAVLFVVSVCLAHDKRSLRLRNTVATPRSIAVALAWAALWRRDAGAQQELARLQRTAFRIRRERDQLRDANIDLQRRNAAIRAQEIAFRDLLNLADERSHGQMRALISTTGAALADLLEAQLARAPQRRNP